MKDVAPELLKAIKRDYSKGLRASDTARALRQKIKCGKCSYIDVDAYAEEVAKVLSDAIEANITEDNLPDGKLYYNISKRVIEPMLQEAYSEVANEVVAVQSSLNRNAGIGLKAIRPQLTQDRIDGILNGIASEVKNEQV